MASTSSSIGTCTLTMPDEVPNGGSAFSSEIAMLRLYMAIEGVATGSKVLVSMVPTGFLAWCSPSLTLLHPFIER